jgi:type VI secretion system protein ImpK
MAPEKAPRRRFATAAAAVEKPKERRDQLSLRSIYAPVLAYVTLFERTEDKSAVESDKFRRGIKDMLDQAGDEAAGAGYSSDTITHVRFSIVAFVDEVVNTSTWPYRDTWMERPLQLEEFDTNIAGEQFFERFESGGEVDPELAEIDFLILSLGFKGKYVSDEKELSRVRQRLFKRFPAQAVQRAPQLTPEAYEEEVHGLEAKATGGGWWKWATIGGAALLVVVVYVVFQVRMGGDVARYERAVADVLK